MSEVSALIRVVCKKTLQDCNNPNSSIPDKMKQALSNASGLSVDVLIHTAGNGWPTDVKKLLSSGNVPESDTTANAFICKQL